MQGEPGLSREATQERRRAVLREAAAIWAATERAEVHRRRPAFVTA